MPSDQREPPVTSNIFAMWTGLWYLNSAVMFIGLSAVTPVDVCRYGFKDTY